MMKMCKLFGCKNVIFASTAQLYGNEADKMCEDDEIAPGNSWAQSKANQEKFLKRYSDGDETSSIISLRYFEPIGADTSRLLGQAPGCVHDNI
jgi:UDP-glucose 4-epimerase